MSRLHCTQRVLKRFRLVPSTSPKPESGRLGHWYANLLNVGRSRWVLCLSERALLPVILPAKNGYFPATLPHEVANVLMELGIDESLAVEEAKRMACLEIDRTRNRQVLGVMNDFSVQASLWLGDGLSPVRAALRVARTPSGPLDYDSPESVARLIFGSESS